MQISRFAVVAVAILASSTVLDAQRGRGGRASRTPEQRQEAARQAYEEEASKPRPIDALDTVWIEEMTYMEVRDAMKDGKTTALLFAGSTEQNGPYLPGGKHQIAIRLVAEAVARTLGDALVAPVIPVEAGNPDDPFLEWGSLYLTAETYRAVVRDLSRSLKSQGFEHILLMGDSGGNTAGLRTVADELSEQWGGSPTIHHIPEFYNWVGGADSVRQFVQDNGIPEEINADGIHDEYGITAVMMVAGEEIVRYDQRMAAGMASINGISIEDKDAVIAFGKKVIEFRANAAVVAIRRVLGGS
jgi:creatinine amidohydrolase/Fe(II)-dependent formamide hydrolase-like protein